MIEISDELSLPENEVELKAIRSQGAGGQNVNKVSSAIHLRLDIHASSLPERVRQRLLELNDRRISRDGIIVIKAQQYRTREQNRQDALERLKGLLQYASRKPKRRVPTRVSRTQKRKRLEGKKQRSRTKQLRSSPKDG